MAIIRITQLKDGKTRVTHQRLGAKADSARTAKEYVNERALDDDVKAAIDEYLAEESVIVYYNREGNEQADIGAKFDANKE
jgi:hypothetical protein